MIFLNQDQIVRGPNPPQKYVQPGYGPAETFSPAKQAPICPIDGGVTRVIGSSDFEYVCQTCGAQLRVDGSVKQAHEHAAPLVVHPNPSRS
jgi:hypothetical protein